MGYLPNHLRTQLSQRRVIPLAQNFSVTLPLNLRVLLKETVRVVSALPPPAMRPHKRKLEW